MNENVKPQNNSEEVDLILILNYIGKGFNQLFNLIANVLKSIFTVFILAIKAIILNFKLIFLSISVMIVLGFVIDKYKPKTYKAQMLVRPYFDSKYQLVNSISYFNALLKNENYSELSSIFEISEEETNNLLEFEINPGPETENDRIVQYDNFIKSIDSIRAQEISFEEFVENRSIYSGELFEIEVTSTKNDIFPKLENGIGKSFTNQYSDKKMRKRDSLIAIQKENILQQLKEVEDLQVIYIDVLEKESQSSPAEIRLGGEGISLNKERTQTREYDLLKQELDLRNALKSLDEKKVEEDVFYDVISSFQDVGNNEKEWYERFVILLPILCFIGLCLLYLTKKTVVYVKNYEA